MEEYEKYNIDPVREIIEFENEAGSLTVSLGLVLRCLKDISSIKLIEVQDIVDEIMK